jgi:hypothetical protein
MATKRIHSVAVSPVVHVRLPDATYRALVERQESFKKQGIEVPLTAIIRGALEEHLGVGKKSGKRK